MIPRLKAASPNHPLKFFAVAADSSWNSKWVASVGPEISATSFHGGYANSPKKWNAQSVTNAVAYAGRTYVPQLKQLRETLDSGGASHVSISADEWGLGPPWTV